MIALTIPAYAEPARCPITAEQVSAALTRAGLQVTAAQVILPGFVVAATSAPVLSIQSIQTMEDHSIVARLGCEDVAKCLPFYVKLRLGGEGTPAADTGLIRQPLPTSAGVGSSSKQISIRPGSQATLLLEGEHLHIRIPVVCIESGRPGEKVRVRGTENRQIYTAEVVDAATLKGRL